MPRAFRALMFIVCASCASESVRANAPIEPAAQRVAGSEDVSEAEEASEEAGDVSIVNFEDATIATGTSAASGAAITGRRRPTFEPMTRQPSTKTR